MNPFISNARNACLDLCDAIENHSEGLTEPSPMSSPTDALMLAWRLVKTTQSVLEAIPPGTRRDAVLDKMRKAADELAA